jgi:hypothetical protein
VITDAILNGVRTLLVGMLSLLPDVSIPWQTPQLGVLLNTANMFMPVSELFEILRILLSAASLIVSGWLVYKLIDWLPFT